MDARRRLSGASESAGTGPPPAPLVPLCAAAEDAACAVSSLSFSCDDDLLGVASPDPI